MEAKDIIKPLGNYILVRLLPGSPLDAPGKKPLIETPDAYKDKDRLKGTLCWGEIVAVGPDVDLSKWTSKTEGYIDLTVIFAPTSGIAIPESKDSKDEKFRLIPDTAIAALVERS
jgi:hypothetical protein